MKKTKLDEAIAATYYIHDCLIAYRDLVNTGSCNDCAKKNTCEYAPALGAIVRYNCPFYKEGEG